MTALETQLTEIVEKEQGQKIIPFLQKLTQEERKSLIPCLSRLEEYYNKFVQLEERTYGTRATSGQHHIIDLAALVIFPLKEFRKHEWGDKHSASERDSRMAYSHVAGQLFR